jgi:dipeptidyl aminopeptidase/acylaminoacyl peptidase
MKAKQNLWRLSLLSMLAICSSTLQAQAPAFTVTGCVELTTRYADQDEFNKWYYDSTYYELARRTKQYKCLRIQYPSDDVQVEAWLYQPRDPGQRKLPLVIYNRGGMGNFGDLTACDLVNFYKIAEAGYVVLASRYRYVGEMGKYDQHGGGDINDILHLQHVYQALPFVDTANVFMYGYSRGGQMCYQASKYMRLNAMATAAGTADWTYRYQDRREFVDGWQDADSPDTDYLGFRRTLPGWATDSLRLMAARSAVTWADSIRVPVLLMHSRLDDRVECIHSLRLATQLQANNKEYALIVYNEPSHSLPFKYFDSYERMFEWFEAHKVGPKTPPHRRGAKRRD